MCRDLIKVLTAKWAGNKNFKTFELRFYEIVSKILDHATLTTLPIFMLALMLFQTSPVSYTQYVWIISEPAFFRKSLLTRAHVKAIENFIARFTYTVWAPVIQ